MEREGCSVKNLATPSTLDCLSVSPNLPQSCSQAWVKPIPRNLGLGCRVRPCIMRFPLLDACCERWTCFPEALRPLCPSEKYYGGIGGQQVARAWLIENLKLQVSDWLLFLLSYSLCKHLFIRTASQSILSAFWWMLIISIGWKIRFLRIWMKIWIRYLQTIQTLSGHLQNLLNILVTPDTFSNPLTFRHYI